MRSALLAFALVVGACAASEPAPEPGEAVSECTETFCFGYPSSWTAEAGEDFANLAHESEDEAVASVGSLNMEGVVTATGGSWPAPAEDASRAFWELLDDLGSASLQSVATQPDGSVVSQGTLDGRRLWHRLIPLDGSRAIAVEVRAPNESWQQHADVILDGLSPISP